jgi:hypothetical protein
LFINQIHQAQPVTLPLRILLVDTQGINVQESLRPASQGVESTVYDGIKYQEYRALEDF